MPRRSRLSKNFQRRSRNTLILSILGIIAVIFLLIKFGIPFISEASFIFGRVTSSSDKSTSNLTDEVFVPVPDLDPLPQATKDKMLKVTGSSLSGLTIQVYLNGSLAGEVPTGSSGDFEKEIALSDGGNIIKARAVKNGKEGEFSDSQTVTVKNSGPTLSIDSPSDQADIHGGNPIQVKGKTDPDATVTVDSFQAIMNSDGSWSYNLTLASGGNDIAVSAVDEAGNRTDKTIHVNYSQ
jgi:hypothetical protein